MAVFKTWVKNIFREIADPDRDVEITELAQLIQGGLAKHKRSFVLTEVLGDRSFKQSHLDEARLSVYEKYLARAWADGRMEASEKEILNWVAKCLELPKSMLKKANLEAARPRFAEALAIAMDDCVISSEEESHLHWIAKTAGYSLHEFMMEFFRTEGEQFLNGVFAASIEAEQSAIDSLDELIATAAKLGLPQEIVLKTIQPQAVRYIEHTLADAKQDEILGLEEEQLLNQLLKRFVLPKEVKSYISSELQEFHLLSELKRGKLPSLKQPSGVSLKAGELVHFHDGATWERLRLLKSGPSTDVHKGFLTISDSRMLFSSSTRSESFSYGSIVSYDLPGSVIKLQLRGRPMQRFVIQNGSKSPSAIFECALRMANQLLTNQDEKRRTRHIPRDIRQRVWQRYSGHCAECNATEYLEFDHVVPVAKGGSNSDANVQLLCRNCNLKKSDLI
ncbi:HNH endonuclease [Bythopirellula polymerisocia]|uniref:HNH endonuclease n=1 Tax=Bythopirellula polymerisocia TaxID=2528003 RepID=A0A5C6D274_9BACT|nr:HNH endonuclease signature motif containing protein [Bythopirellula polymerisocia]TWU29881.1 HNH endonuclease [Bythopirellula polymerisocia]